MIKDFQKTDNTLVLTPRTIMLLSVSELLSNSHILSTVNIEGTGTFEGFVDLLSVVILKSTWMAENEYLILNSLAFANQIEERLNCLPESISPWTMMMLSVIKLLH